MQRISDVTVTATVNIKKGRLLRTNLELVLSIVTLKMRGKIPRK